MAKPIYDMTPEEVIDFINGEAKFYDETVNRDALIPPLHYFSKVRFKDEDLYNLYFACDVMYSTAYGQDYQEKLNPVALEMFGLLQLEFYTRIGHPNPYSAVTVVKL